MNQRYLRIITTFGILGLVAGALAIPSTVQASTYVVNTTDQRWDLGDWPCTLDHCSLWEAVVSANVHPGPDRITFDLPGDPPYIIYLGDPAHPGLTYQELNIWDNDTEIDATTQPGGKVYLHGLGNAGTGMIIRSDRNTVRGLGFLGFNSDGIRVNGERNFLYRIAVGEYLGEGFIPEPTSNEIGILLSGEDNTIRGATVANNAVGIDVRAGHSTIQDSHIGTVIRGATRRGNHRGISLSTAGYETTIERNTIVGNELGIQVYSGGNTIIRNYIGCIPSSMVPIGNEIGILLATFEGDNRIGGTGIYEGNVIVDNDIGVEITGIGNQILNNRIGVDFSGTAIPNRIGVFIHPDPELATLDIVPSGALLGTGFYEAGNVIAYNTEDGVWIDSASQVFIQHNLIHHNGGDGIHLSVEEGTIPADGMRINIRANSMFDNGGLGIHIPDPAYANDVEPPAGLRYVRGSIIGTACPGCRVELFIAAADPTGFGEGKTFLERETAGSDGSFSIPVPELRTCDLITATATDALGNTSVFSRNATALLCFRLPTLAAWIFLFGGAGAGAGSALLIALRRQPLTLRQAPWVILGVFLGAGLAVVFLNMPFVEISWPARQERPPSNPGLTISALPQPEGVDAREGTSAFIHPATPTIWLPDSADKSTPTPTSSIPAASMRNNANCRRGPGTDYDIVTSLPPGLTVPIIGRNPNNSWWQVQVPGTQTQCWVFGENAEASGDVSGVPIVEPDPLGCWVWTGNQNECKAPCPEGAQPGGACTP
ncbi:MAG: right-handed parallel beta-helix repeat-containing protein [Anaerolineales bacterium]|nr:right-handed parallel beta-helix repeat-containing protein [Anaerolineales bacterium]